MLLERQKMFNVSMTKIFYPLDIDECSAGHKCDVNAVCNNTKGSYNCTCNKGFYGEGRSCVGALSIK